MTFGKSDWGTLAVLVATMVSAISCSVNDVGFVRVRHYENETARAVLLESWGIHLTAGTADSGITLGRDRRTYVFRRDGAGLVQVPLDALTGSRDAATLMPADSSPGLLQLGTPVATFTEREGVAVDVGSARVGVSLGFLSHGAIELPNGSDTVLLIRATNGSSRPPDVIIGKELQ